MTIRFIIDKVSEVSTLLENLRRLGFKEEDFSIFSEIPHEEIRIISLHLNTENGECNFGFYGRKTIEGRTMKGIQASRFDEFCKNFGEVNSNKIYVRADNPEQSKEVQKLLFLFGYRWQSSGKNYINVDGNDLVFFRNIKTIAHQKRSETVGHNFVDADNLKYFLDTDKDNKNLVKLRVKSSNEIIVAMLLSERTRGLCNLFNKELLSSIDCRIDLGEEIYIFSDMKTGLTIFGKHEITKETFLLYKDVTLFNFVETINSPKYEDFEFKTAYCNGDLFKIAEKEKEPKTQEKQKAQGEGESYNFVEKPNHYTVLGKEVFEMMEDIWGKDALIKFCQMNSFKYRMRAGHKPSQSVETDIKKAKYYENKINELKIKK
ncbi:SaV-like protein [Tenacibaculum phage Larrie]|nr:SaV-like protein [Tenacibaculum phage Larrie]